MTEKVQTTDIKAPAAEGAAPAAAAVPGAVVPPAPRRGPGHRGADVRDTVAEMTEKAQQLSLEADSKVSGAMKDVIYAAAGMTGFAIESARDLVQYMVRRGQMRNEEADKLLRDVEEAHATRKPGTPHPPRARRRPPHRSRPRRSCRLRSSRRRSPTRRRSSPRPHPSRTRSSSASRSRSRSPRPPERAHRARPGRPRRAHRPKRRSPPSRRQRAPASRPSRRKSPPAGSVRLFAGSRPLRQRPSVLFAALAHRRQGGEPFSKLAGDPARNSPRSHAAPRPRRGSSRRRGATRAVPASRPRR